MISFPYFLSTSRKVKTFPLEFNKCVPTVQKKKKTKKEIQHRNTRGRHNQPLANFSFTCLTQDTNQMASTKVKNNKAMQLEDKSCFPVMPGNSGSVSRMAIMQVVLKEWC